MRFGNGALEDLLPAIREGDMAMEMEFDDGEDEVRDCGTHLACTNICCVF